MKTLLTVAICIMSASLGCSSPQRAAGTTPAILEEEHQSQARLKDATLSLVRFDQGELAAEILNVCYLSGYPADGSKGAAIPNLRNRERDQCDAILKRQAQHDARDAAERKRLDDAYDKRHPKMEPAAQDH